VNPIGSARGIVYNLGPEPGWRIATVYGVRRRALRFNLVRWMDGPGWKIEPASTAFGVEQEGVEAADAFLEDYMIRGPYSTLRAAKAALSMACYDERKAGRD
jgi:hypothetical protein